MGIKERLHNIVNQHVISLFGKMQAKDLRNSPNLQAELNKPDFLQSISDDAEMKELSMKVVKVLTEYDHQTKNNGVTLDEKFTDTYDKEVQAKQEEEILKARHARDLERQNREHESSKREITNLGEKTELELEQKQKKIERERELKLKELEMENELKMKEIEYEKARQEEQQQILRAKADFDLEQSKKQEQINANLHEDAALKVLLQGHFPEYMMKKVSPDLATVRVNGNAAANIPVVVPSS